MAEDYYKTLGVAKTANKEEIKKAYKKKAMQYHPDKNQGDKQAEETFKKVNEAYAVLSDEEKRQQYDRYGAEDFSNRFTQNDIFKNFDLGKMFKEFGFGNDTFSSIFSGNTEAGSQSPFSSIFGKTPFPDADYFSDQATSYPNGDSEIEIILSFKKAVLGGKKKVILKWGTARYPFIIIISPGIKEGQKLRVKKKGDVDVYHGRRGDLYCRVKVLKDKVFSRQEDDLLKEQEVDLTKLILGASIPVLTIDGEKIDLKIPPLTSNNEILRVKGKGVAKKDAPPGYLLVRLVAKLPDILTSEQEEIFNELKETGV